jgi:hypothetical protein
MKIYRDGKEYELTQQELREAYLEKDLDYLKEDIMTQDDQNDFNFDDSDFETIADRFKRALERCDGYWDYYWSVMSCVINEYIKEGEHND